MIVLLMGPAASGKTTIGLGLASKLGWTFLDADDLHPRANVDKMQRGEALTDEDRAPWLARVRARIDELHAQGKDAVVAASALRQSYRDELGADRVVLLDVPPDVLASRLSKRTGHFFPPALLASQLATLERPGDAIVIDATQPPDDVVAAIEAALAE